MARAVTQPVYASPAVTSGRQWPPADDTRSTKTLTYTQLRHRAANDPGPRRQPALNVDTGAQDSDAVALGSTRLTVPARADRLGSGHAHPRRIEPGPTQRPGSAPPARDGLVIRTAIGTALDGPPPHRHVPRYGPPGRAHLGSPSSSSCSARTPHRSRTASLWLPPWSDKISISRWREGHRRAQRHHRGRRPARRAGDVHIHRPELRSPRTSRCARRSQGGPDHDRDAQAVRQQAHHSATTCTGCTATAAVISHGVMHFNTVKQVIVDADQAGTEGSSSSPPAGNWWRRWCRPR